MNSDDKQNNNNQVSDLDKKYEDLGGITEKKLNIGLWYVEHKRKLRLGLIVFLVLAGVISWVYTIYNFGYYIYRGMEEDEILAVQIAKIGAVGHEYISQIAPVDLEFYPAKMLKTDGNRYDFFVETRNSNKNYWAEIDYYFLADNKEIGRAKSFILPDESKFLMALGEDFNFRPAKAEFRLANVSWRRVNKHEIADWEDFKNKHLNISLSDIDFIPARESETSEKIGLNYVSFDAANNSAYNFWETDFAILLYRGSSVIGVNKYTLSEFMAGQKRHIRISWPGDFAQVSKAEIAPAVNIMNPGVYIKYEGGVGEEK